jgi:hypothetical protein
MSQKLVALLSTAFIVALPLTTTAQAGCVWRGTAPICSGRCNANEIQVDVSGSGRVRAGEPRFGETCFSGSKALCCTRCPSGLVWREKTFLDVVCVTPAERAAAQGH